MKRTYSILTLFFLFASFNGILFGQSVYDFHTNGLNYAKQNKDQKGLVEIVNTFVNTSPDYSLLTSQESSNLLSQVNNKAQIMEVASGKINLLVNKVDQNLLSDFESFYHFIEGISSKVPNRSEILSAKSRSRTLEVANGYELLLSSFDFWIDPNNNDGGNVAAFIQLDAAGYIIGWVDAVIDDYNAGNLNPEGQWRRIRKGATFGLGCSIGKWF